MKWPWKRGKLRHEEVSRSLDHAEQKTWHLARLLRRLELDLELQASTSRTREERK